MKCFKRNILLITTLLCLPLLMVVNSCLAETGKQLESVEFSGCSSCHETPHRALMLEIASENCLSCHKEQKFQVDHTNTLEQPGSIEEGEFTSGPIEANGGMSVPMYYEKSRIGADPNQMIKIPAGEFIMGTDNRLPDEGPQHTVFLEAYLIDKYEVTNLQYKKFIDDTGHKSPKHFMNRTFPEGKIDHPVTYVTWKDADDYCQWAGKRLPTDQEWEKAARGTDGRAFPWGNEFDINKANMPQRWMTLKREGDTTPVGAFEGGVSPYGLYDTSGNVWEWTSSWYLPYPGNTRITENYGEKYKTLKGGSWWDCSFYKCGVSAPVYNRSFFMRTTRNKSFGFRCAKDIAKDSR